MLLASFYVNYKKVFGLAVTGDNTKNTKNVVIQRKYQNYSSFVYVLSFKYLAFFLHK